MSTPSLDKRLFILSLLMRTENGWNPGGDLKLLDPQYSSLFQWIHHGVIKAGNVVVMGTCMGQFVELLCAENPHPRLGQLQELTDVLWIVKFTLNP